MKNIKEFCRRCRHEEELSDRDPCRSCMDFGIAALGRPVNFREKEERGRVENIYQNLMYCSEQAACSDKQCAYYYAYPHCDNALMREAAQVLDLIMKERDQAVKLLKEIAAKEGICTGCVHNAEPFCAHPKKDGECGRENNYWEWRGIFEEGEQRNEYCGTDRTPD